MAAWHSVREVVGLTQMGHPTDGLNLGGLFSQSLGLDTPSSSTPYSLAHWAVGC